MTDQQIEPKSTKTAQNQQNDDGADAAYLRREAAAVRLDTLDMIVRGRSGHIGSNFSAADVLTVLYARHLRHDALAPDDPERDWFIMSKGHACAGLYAILARQGFFPPEWLSGFYQNGGRLWGHATHADVPGVEVSTGSLGHGLPIAVGVALASKRAGRSRRVFVMLSDGECDEGTTWESALIAHHHRLGNLVTIIDYNKLQSIRSTESTLDLEPLADKWRAFGWHVVEIDGHDVEQIDKALNASNAPVDRPTCIIAHTIKGRGVDFMENDNLWHYRTPDETELAAAQKQLEGQLA